LPYSKVLATHRKLISKSINRETGHHSILDRLIILEMNGHHNLSDNHYASMLVAHLTLVRAFRRMFIWLIKSLAENITWQDKIRDEIIKMKPPGLYVSLFIDFEISFLCVANTLLCNCLMRLRRRYAFNVSYIFLQYSNGLPKSALQWLPSSKSNRSLRIFSNPLFEFAERYLGLP
jgi:hypothetical protein